MDICTGCTKNEESDNGHKRRGSFIKESDTSAPQSVLDIKIDAKNFVIERKNTNCSDVYEKIKFLGEGTFGSVYKVKRKNAGTREIIRAMKEISKKKICRSKENEDELRNEIEVLKNLDHPNIVKIFEFYEDDYNMYIINEYCSGGDFADLMDK